MVGTPDSSRVEWVSPPNNTSHNSKSLELNKPENAINNNTSLDHNDNYKDDSTTQSTNNRLKNIQRASQGKSNNFLKFAVERAISIIKDEHLNRLNGHNLLIGSARSNVKASNDDRSRKIRDEQVKAISTIKQLTNDLKELTRLELQCKSADAQELLNRLDDTRSRLIQATNQFMLANEDINRIPIHHSSPSTYLNQLEELDESTQYDYCDDAKYINNIRDINFGTERTQMTESQPDDKIIHDIVEQEMIMKLERDTLELRRLFGEFYETVNRQRERLDSIESNIISTTENVDVGKQHLHKANRNLTVLVPITGCVAGALIGGPIGLVVGGKVGGLTVGCISTVLGLVTSYGAQKCVSSL